jgi:phosphatidate phosphatase PAH1
VSELILKAKIKSEHLKKIMEGKKTLEFRQFDGSDRMEVTDENGRTTMLRIKGAYEADKKFEKTVKDFHRDVNWNENEPVIVFRVEPWVMRNGK